MSVPDTEAVRHRPGLLAKLMARVRSEFRAEVYLIDPEDPVLGRASARCLVATGRWWRTGCAQRTGAAGANGAARR